MLDIVAWYEKEMGIRAAQKVAKTIQDIVHTLSSSPYIGIQDYKFPKTGYECRYFVFHPKYKIYYRFNSTEIRIRAFQATEMNPHHI